MAEKKSSKKALVIGIIAAVLILAALVVVLVLSLSGSQEEVAAPTTEATEALEQQGYEIYWNLDRAQYDGKSEAGMSSRMPESDGYFHVRFFKDGETVELKVADRKVINQIDILDMMDLVFDEDGIIVDAIPVEQLPLQKMGWQFYVQSVGGNLVKVNSAKNFMGLEVLLELAPGQKVYDMTGTEGEPGVAVTPIAGDRVFTIADLEGNITHMFIFARDTYMHTFEGMCAHCKQNVTWSKWVKTDEGPATSGHYQLQGDITLKKQISTAEDAKICLDLNGYTIHGAEGQRVLSLHNAGTELALMDTSEGQTGALRSHGELKSQGGVVWVRFGQFHMYGGTLDGSDCVNLYNGAVMCLQKNTYAYIYGGTIKGGTAQYMIGNDGKATNGLGGNIQVYGKLVINDGLIIGGKAVSQVKNSNGKLSYARGYGGNIYVGTGGVLEINGGKIANGVAGSAGGNVYIDGTCEMTMNDGVIGGGKLTGHDRNGGNLFVGSKAVLTINGGIIRNGQVYNGGGNLYANGAVTMNGGQIYGGKVIDKETGKEKAAVHNNLYVVNGKFHMYGGKISGGACVSDTSATDDKKVSLVLSGYATIYGAAKGRTNLTLSSSGDKVLVQVGQFRDEAKIGISTTRGIFTMPRDISQMDHFVSDVANADVVYYDGAYALGRVGCLCGQEIHEDFCDEKQLLWSPWTTENSLPENTGNYYLTAPVKVTKQSNVRENQSVILDLNGFEVTGDSVSRIYSVHYSGASLTITDYKKTGVIKSTSQEADLGGIVLVRSNTSLTLLAGTLDASQSVVINKNGGGAVFVNTNGSFTMAGGTIKGGTAVAGNGGAVAVVKGGHMTLTGGTVEGGKAEAGKGGNISILGTMEMTGGEVKGGKAQYGGNIYVEGQMTLSGGKINGGEGSTRNLLVINGQLTLSGGQIDGGVAIDDRTAGDGVETALYISGNPVITGASQNLSLTDRGDGAKVYVGKMESGAQVGVTASGGVFTQPCEAGNAAYFVGDKPNVGVVYYDGALALGKLGCLCGKTTHLPGCDKEEHLWTPWMGENLPITTGYWYLTGDVTMNAASEVRDAQQVVLDLNGCKVTGSVLRLYSAAATDVSITITDTVGGGMLQNTRQNGDLGGIVLVRSGASLTLMNGVLDAGKSSCSNNNGGGAVFVNTNGTFTMYGGKVIGGEVTGNGGAIVIAKGGHMTLKGGAVEGGKAEAGKGGNISVLGTMVMEGGSVTGGKAQYGGNIYVEGKLTLTGGSVTGGVGNTRNILALNGQLEISGGHMDGGVTVDDRTAGDGIRATLWLSGNPVITGASQNLNLATRGDGARLYVGAMTEGADVGITGQAGYISEPCAEGSEAYLHSDSNTMDVVWYDGALALGKVGCVCGKETHLAGCDQVKHLWMPWTEESLPGTTGYWYLTKGFTVDEVVNISADQAVVLDLNGQTVKAQDTRIYSVDVAGADLVITDRTKDGEGTLKVMGTNGASALCVYVRNGNFTLFGGHLDASEATSTHTGQGGSAIWVNKNRTFYMYGGTVKGNLTACMNGGTIEVSSGGFMELHGGTVYGAETTKALNGTAINVSGTLKIFDGTVEGGSTTGVGGTICVKGVLEMSGGTVTGGEASNNGGNIYISGTGSMTFTGGTVKDGTSKYGKNLFVEGTLIMEGGKVENGNVLIIDGEMTFTGGEILDTLNVDDRAAGGETTLVTLSGAPVVNAIKLESRGDSVKLCVGKLADSVQLSLTAPAGHFASLADGVDGDQAAARFTSTNTALRISRQADGLHLVDKTAVIHCLCGQKPHLPGCDGNEHLWQPWGKTNTKLPATTGYWYLTDSWTLSGEASLAANQAVVLDLNNQTVTSASGSRVYNVNTAGASLVITDSSAEGKGTIVVTGSSSNSGRGIYVRNGDATWVRGILDASAASTTNSSQGGVAVWINQNRTFNLYGGTIIGGSVTQNGGAIDVGKNATMNMYGGTVTGGTIASGKLGQTMYVNADGTLHISGGTVNGELYADGTLSLSGEVIIQTLVAKDLSKFTVGELTEGSAIAISGTGVVANNVQTDVAAYFTDKATGKQLVYDATAKTLTIQ